MKSIRTALAASMLAAGAILGTATLTLAGPAPDDQSSPDEMQGTPRDGGHWHHGHGEGLWHLYHQLGLSDAQKASMKSILAEARPTMKTLHEQRRANEMKLMQASPGSADYGSVVSEVAQSNASLASRRTSADAQLRAQLYAVLTPAQQSQLAGLQAQWAARAAQHQSEAR